MLGITNLKPIESINSVLQPLGLKVSNKEQMISKLAWVTLASLTIYNLLSTVEGIDQNRLARICDREAINIANCKDGCKNRLENARDYTNAIRNCFAWCINTHGRTHRCNHS